MGGFEDEPERTWDEYDWERFLQQQDHKTEKYMELLETYLDHPQRDQIIAQEMGEVVRNSIHYRALFMVGLVLFTITLVINYLAQKLVMRYRMSIG